MTPVGFDRVFNTGMRDNILIALLIFCGLLFTVRTRFVQIRCFGDGWRAVFGSIGLSEKQQTGALSSFQALTAAVAAQIGTGNIIGVSGAILIGGPGAVFWMWIIAFFGMATIYAEAVLAQKTRTVDPDGTVHGGPVYYIERAFPNGFGVFLSVFFSLATVIALGFTGCMVQSNSISAAFTSAMGVPPWAVGAVITLAAAFVFLGDVRRLGSVTEKLVPMMAVLYLGGGVVLLILRARYLPETVAMIFRYAFRPDAIIGGSAGTALKLAISQGAKRGLFSNEAGMGSTPHAHAMANVKRPHDQGLAAIMGLFIDTFVVLTVTALAVISTLYAGNGPLASGAAEGLSGNNMAQLAFSCCFGKTGGNIFVALCLAFFAFSTVLSWNFFGRLNVLYLSDGRKWPVTAYTVLSLTFIFLGSVTSSDLVWELSDMFNQLMVIPNVIALIALSGTVGKEAGE